MYTFAESADSADQNQSVVHAQYDLVSTLSNKVRFLLKGKK